MKKKILKKIWNITISCIQSFIKKDDKIILIGSWFGKRYSDNSRYLYEYLDLNKKKYGINRIIWITDEKGIYEELKNQKKEVYLKKSLKSIFLHFKARYHIIDQSPDDLLGKLSSSKQTIKINLWHGIPLKKIGKYMNQNKEKKTSAGKKIGVGNWQEEKVLVCSKFGEDTIGDAFEIEVSNCFYGMYPRINYLLEENFELLSEEKEIERLLISKIKENKKIVFYLPTFRDKKEILFLGENNKEKLIEFLEFLDKNNYFLVTKLHFAGTNVMKRKKDEVNKIIENRILNIPSHIDIYPFLKKTDILITDYSSVYFDFLFLDRDIIFYPYDLDYYKNEDRGLLLDYDEYTPGDKVFNIEELKINLEKKLVRRDNFKEKRKKLLEEVFGNYTIDDTIKNILEQKNKL